MESQPSCNYADGLKQKTLPGVLLWSETVIPGRTAADIRSGEVKPDGAHFKLCFVVGVSCRGVSCRGVSVFFRRTNVF